MSIKVDEKYTITSVDPLFFDWIGVVAECKSEKNGFYEMHANNAFIYCRASQLRKKFSDRKKPNSIKRK